MVIGRKIGIFFVIGLFFIGRKPGLSSSYPADYQYKDSLSRLSDYLKQERTRLPADTLALLADKMWRRAIGLRDTTYMILSLENKAYAEHLKNRFDLSEAYILQAIALARRAGNTELYLREVSELGGYYMRRMKNSEAERLLSSFIRVYEDSVRYAGYLFNMRLNLGAALLQAGSHEKALQVYLKLLDEVKPGQKSLLRKIHYNLGFLYYELQQFDKAEKHLEAGLRITPEKNKDFYAEYLHERLAAVYEAMEKHEPALAHYTKAVEIFKKQDNKVFLALSLRNMAAIYLNTDKWNEAIRYAKQAVSLSEEIGLDFIKNGAAQILTMAYIHSGQWNKAKEIITNIIEKQDIKKLDKYGLIDYHNLFYEYYQGTGNYQKALKHYIEMSRIQDSVLKSEKQALIAEIEAKYQNEKKQKEILKLKARQARKEKELAQERNQKLMLGGGFLSSSALLLLIGVFFIREKRQKRIVEQLQRELHHRIKNNLALISSLVDKIYEKYEVQDALAEELENLKIRIDNIHTIHKQLLAEEQVTHVNMRDYVNRLSDLIKSTFIDKPVTITRNISKFVCIKADKSLVLGLIINEFLLNSFKHAFEPNQPGEIQIELKETEKDYILYMSDNGKGLPENFDTTDMRSFGLDIMHLLSRQLGGSFTIESRKGVKVIIQFPK